MIPELHAWAPCDARCAWPSGPDSAGPRAPPRPTQSLRAESSISKSRDERRQSRADPTPCPPCPLHAPPRPRVWYKPGLPRAAHTPAADTRAPHARAPRRETETRRQTKEEKVYTRGMRGLSSRYFSRYVKIETEGTGSVTACADNCARFTFLNNTTTKFSVSGASRSEGQHYFGAFGARCRRRSAPPLSPCSARGSAALVQRSAARPPYY